MLYGRYVRNESTPEETLLFLRVAAEREQELESLFNTTWEQLDVHPGQYNLPDIVVPVQAAARRKVWRRITVVSVFACIALGTVRYIIKNTIHVDEQRSVSLLTDIPPAKTGGMLTLADGRNIPLDEAVNGKLADERGTVVLKDTNGIIYNGAGAGPGISYNTLTVPRGRQLSLTLSDGTRVWLNANSSIRFPATFRGKSREVELKGEVYLEVARNAAMPFIVSAKQTRIEVLGTQFNVNTYEEGVQVKTALLEGAVKVNTPGGYVILAPGQQSSLSPDGILKVERGVNMEEVVAWKNGYFHFESAGLKTILDQFAQWYDIDVVYQGKVTDRRFFAIVKRTGTLGDVLKLLEEQDIHFRIDGRQLFVMGD